MRKGIRHLINSSLLAALLIATIALSGCGGSSGSGGTSGGSGSSTGVAGSYCFVCNTGDNTLGAISLTDNSYKSIELKGGSTEKSAIAVGSTPSGVSVDAKNSVAVVTNRGANTISIVNIVNLAQVAVLDVGQQPLGVQYSPIYDSFAGLANFGSGTIDILNSTTGYVTYEFTVGGNPTAICISNDGLTTYATNSNLSMSIINMSGGEPSVTGNIPNIGDGGIDMDANSAYLYVANSTVNGVTRVNVNSTSTTLNIPVGNNPNDVACSPKDANKIYVTNGNDNTVSVINGGTNTVTSTIAVGTTPKAVVFSPDGSKAYVANSGSNSVSIINTSTDSVAATVSVGSYPTALGTTPW
ncbi:MAG: YncE family protein [Vulcanimicrobiota bacterium]